MKENQKIAFLVIFLVISMSFFVLGLPVSASSVANNQFVIYSAHTANNYYTVDVMNDNSIIFSKAGQKIWSQKIDRQIGSIAISPDGEYIAIGCDGGVIYLYDTYWSVQLLWTRTFGDASIRSISFQENGNFIEVTNALNQAFLITRTGNLVPSSITQAVTPVPLATISLPQIPTAQNNVPINNDTSDFFGISFFWWGILALIALWILWVNISSNRKKGTARTYQPPPQPQNGIIYADSIPNGAAIYIDGTYVGVSPVTIPNVWLGGHTLKATLNGYHFDLQRITISAGQTFVYSPNLRKISPPTPKTQPRPTPPKPTPPPVSQPKSFQDLINQLGAKAQQDREEAQKQLIIKVNTEGKTAIQQIIKELEKQPSGVKREIINLLYYLSKESHDGQKVTEELILALTYSSPEVKWLIIQTLGRLKDKSALSAIEAATLDADFLVKYWAIISLKNIQES